MADTISCLKTANLYEEPKDKEVSKTLETIDDIMKKPNSRNTSTQFIFH